MIDKKAEAQSLLEKFLSVEDLKNVNLKLCRKNVPGFFDPNDDEENPSVVQLLKKRWRVTKKVEALRRALFVGCLDDSMQSELGSKTETLVRYFDEASGLNLIESVTTFLAQDRLQYIQPTTDESPQPSIDPDRLTKEFLSDCYKKSVDFALPSWEGEHAVNTKGTVRALAWLQKPLTLTFAPICPNDFPVEHGKSILLVEDEGDEETLKKERLEKTSSTQGTGINEYTAFVWCNLSLNDIKDHNVDASIVLKKISKIYIKQTGKIELNVYRLDHAGLKILAGKAKRRGIVGPLRLSANALMLEPLSASVIIQKKRERDLHHPFHTFGGSFLVAAPQQSENYVPSDGTDIVRCVRREVLEESNIALPISSKRPFKEIPSLLLLQTDKPFLQVCFLGWQVPTTEIDHCFVSKESDASPSNQEGTAIRMPLIPGKGKNFQSVAEAFYKADQSREPWRPAGLLALYAWYKIGCPGIDATDKERLEDELKRNEWPN